MQRYELPTMRVESQASGSFLLAYQTDVPMTCGICKRLIPLLGWYTKHSALIPGRDPYEYAGCLNCYPVCLPTRSKRVTEPMPILPTHDVAAWQTRLMPKVETRPLPQIKKKRTIMERLKARLENF